MLFCHMEISRVMELMGMTYLSRLTPLRSKYDELEERVTDLEDNE